MAVEFRITRHTFYSDISIVEILIDKKVCGVIYPLEKGIKLVSAHIEKVIEDDGSCSQPPIPAVFIDFNPRPYKIIGNKIVRL